MKSFGSSFMVSVSLVFLFGHLYEADAKPPNPNAQFRNQNTGAPPKDIPGCTPTTCEKAHADCGNISDGCGKVLDCGIVKNTSVTVTPQQYKGICPKIFKFTATITTAKKGTARYRWIHHPLINQGGVVEFSAPGTKQVFFEWAVPHSVLSQDQWLSFNACGVSNDAKAYFKVECTSLKPIGGNTIPQ